MAKQTVQQRTNKHPAKAGKLASRSVAAKKPLSKQSTKAARPVAKTARSAKSAARPVTVVRPKRPVILAKAVARTLKPAAKKVVIPIKPSAKSSKPAAAPAKPTKAAKAPVVAKPAVVAKPLVIAKATPAAKQAAAIAKAPPTPAKPVGAVVAKVATPAGLVPTSKLAAKPATPPTVAKAPPTVAKAPLTKPGVGVRPAPAATNGVAVEVKPTGRPMLSQGPFVGSTLTKRGTFAPDKLLAPAPKLPRKRPEPIVAPVTVTGPRPPAIATADKAAKNRAGLNQRDLEFFRDLLLAKRRELLGDMSSMEREALREGSSDLSTLPIHMADQGTDAYEQEFTLGLVEKDRTLLRELNNALAKIQNGSYGICEGTGLPISKPRLEAQPWAKYSIEHARAMEKKQMTFRR